MNISVYSFTPSLQVRAVIRDGEPWLVAQDVAAALDYSDTEAMTRGLDADERGTCTDNSSGQARSLTVISESGLYSAILRSRKPEAKSFKKWVTSEVLPAIRKTGAYAVPNATVPPTPASVEAVMFAAALNQALNLSGSAALSTIHRAVTLKAPDMLSIVPVYAIDAPSGSGAVSSETTDSLSALMKANDIKGTAATMNVRLEMYGFLEKKTRAGQSGEKSFWSVTEAGQKYGKNLTSPQNQRETQPHWYRDTFLDLMAVVNTK